MSTLTFQATSGTFVIVTYASAIFDSTGVNFDMSPELQALSIPLTMIIASFSLTFIVEKFGRKPLLTGAFFVTSITLTTLGVAIQTQNMGGTVPTWLPVTMMTLAVFMYAGGVCPLPYIILTEMFSYQIRTKVMGGVVTYTWFISFITMSLYTPISTAYGLQTVFYIFGAINFLGAIYVFIFLPETKGKNYSEIRNSLTGTEEEEKLMDSL